MKPSHAVRGCLALLAGLAALAAHAQEPAPPPEGGPLSRSRFAVEYAERETPAYYSSFVRLTADYEHGRWLNPGAGLELDVGDNILLSYYLADTMRLTKRQGVTLRLHHLEYTDWKIGVNTVNLYHHFDTKHYEGKFGLAYLAVVYDPGHFQEPWYFDSEAPELRVLYSLAFRQGFLDDRFGARVGAQDFNAFENYGYENLGVFVEPYLNLNDHWKLRFLYEWRWAGVYYRVPYLNRRTMIIGVEYQP